MSCCKNKLIVIMGASCSGKSTLSKKLLSNLGSEWKFVGLDEIEDYFKSKKILITDNDLIDAVMNQANECLADGYNVVIDTNMYDCKFIEIRCDYSMFLLVYCPLKILLERNAARDRTLQRTPQRARYAQEYVVKTFYNFERHQCYDLKIDSSLLSLDESIQKIVALIS